MYFQQHSSTWIIAGSAFIGAVGWTGGEDLTCKSCREKVTTDVSAYGHKSVKDSMQYHLNKAWSGNNNKSITYNIRKPGSAFLVFLLPVYAWLIISVDIELYKEKKTIQIYKSWQKLVTSNDY